MFYSSSSIKAFWIWEVETRHLLEIKRYRKMYSPSLEPPIPNGETTLFYPRFKSRFFFVTLTTVSKVNTERVLNEKNVEIDWEHFAQFFACWFRLKKTLQTLWRKLFVFSLSSNPKHTWISLVICFLLFSRKKTVNWNILHAVNQFNSRGNCTA